MADIDPIVVSFDIDDGGMKGSADDILSTFNQISWGIQHAEMIADTFVNKIKEMGDAAESILNLANAFDMSTGAIQQWQQAAIVAGGDAGTFESMIQKLTIAMSKVADPTSDVAAAFDKLGISDVSNRPVADILAEVAVKLNEVESATDRAAIAQALFGRNFVVAEATLKNYNSTLTETTVLTKEQLITLSDAGDAIDKFSIKVDYLSKVVFADLIKGQIGASDSRKTLKSMWGTTDASELAKPFVSSIEMAAGSFDAFYGDMSALEIALYDSREKQADALAAMKEAHSQEEYTAAEKVWALEKNHYNELMAMQAKLGAAAVETATKVAAANIMAWSGGKSIGDQGLSSAGFTAAGGSEEQWKLSGAGEDSAMFKFMKMEQEAGTTYSAALTAWANGKHSAGVDAGAAGENPEKKTADAAAEAHKKQISETTDFSKNMSKLYESMYINTEKLSLTHWTAESELGRIAVQSIMDNWATGVNYCNSTIAHLQTITVTDGKENAQPIVYATAAAPTLAAADFSGVKFVVASSGGGEKSGAASVTNNVNVVIQGNANADDVEKGVNKGLAGVQYAGGGFV